MRDFILHGGRVCPSKNQQPKYGFQIWEMGTTKYVIPLGEDKKPEFQPPHGAKLLSEVLL